MTPWYVAALLGASCLLFLSGFLVGWVLGRG
jgi:hypothetical protein